MKYIFNGIFIILLLFYAVCANAQQYYSEEGVPFFVNYESKQYKAHIQNFAVAEDKRGVMYFGNFAGVLEFDGVYWRKILTTKVSSLAVDSTGRVYVGANGEFGCLVPDSAGEMCYHQIFELDKNNRPNRPLDVNAHIRSNSIYFVADSTFFVLTNNSVNRIELPKPVLSSFLVKNKLFFLQKDSDLVYEENGKFSAVKYDKKIGRILDIKAILPSKNKIIVVSGNQGLFRLRNDSIIRYKTASDNFLTTVNISCATMLSDGNIALGSTRNGIFVLTPYGIISRVINKSTGLPSENVNSLYIDTNNDLWAALNNGISKIELLSPLSTFGEKSGLRGGVNEIIRFENRLYFATTYGLFYISKSEKLESINKITTACWDMKVVNNTLYAATSKGVYSIGRGGIIRKTDDFCLSLFYTPDYKDMLFIGQTDGLSILNTTTGVIGRIREITDEIREIGIYNGILWLSTPSKGIISFNSATSTVNRYGIEQGLPDLISNSLTFISSRLVVTTKDGLYTFNKQTNKFVKNNNILTIKTDSNIASVCCMTEDQGANIYATAWDETNIFMLNKNKDNYTYLKQPLLPVSDRIIRAIYPDKNGIVWFGGPEGIIRYNRKNSKDYNDIFNTLIRKVFIGNDSLIFSGTFFNSDNVASLVQNSFLIPSIKHKYNSLRFEFAAMNYNAGEELKFGYMLEGLDPDWSDWSVIAQKDYTNIPEGEYIFKVRAKNIYGLIGNEATFRFSILTPWYNTWWAYLLYALVFITGIYLIIRWRIHQLKKEKRHLEEIVKQRTAEVVKQKEVIEQKNADITASINYASRIQSAVLPPSRTIENGVSEHFIFFKPREIVSGDFYWLKHIKNYNNSENSRVFITAADCTGHGVPGAFMSMLGLSFLNEIVSRQHETRADHVLNELRNRIKTSLRQTGKSNEAKDGMDIALCILDIPALTMQYAGAYNPLYWVRDTEENKAVSAEDFLTEGSEEEKLIYIEKLYRQNSDDNRYELVQVNADKMPIGIYFKEKGSFSNRKIKVAKGDTFYIFSDGFVDQIGGDEGKKFMQRKFKKLFLSMQYKTLNEQKEIIEHTFNEWKGKYSQVDDIIVIGFKI